MLKDIEIRHIIVQATVGAELSNALRSAENLAAKEKCRVTLVHNGKEYERDAS